eukprot:g2135.t1
MQNYLQDHDSVRSILEFTRDAQEQTRSKFALHEKPVLRGNVIAESEQDLAELLSRYQQGYYRPNEASLALLSDQEADLSRQFRDDKESCEAQQSLEEGYKRGSMMQMQHVAKARLLMRHPTSQYCNATTNGSSNMTTTTTSTSTSSNPHEFHTTTTVSRDLQFRPDFNSIRWPVSLDSIQHPERYQFHETVTEYHPYGPTQMVQDPQWLDSLTPEGQFDWTQGTSDYGLGFGTSPETMDLYDSNLFYKHPLSSTTDFPSSSQSTVISKNPYFHTGSDNPYHYMTPTPSFQDSRTFDDQFRSFDGYYSNCGSFLDSRIEAISGQDSNRSSQEKVPGFHSYGLDESRITRSGMGASFEFLDGLLPPEATAAVRSYPTRRGVPTGRTRSRKQEPSQTQGLLKGGSGDHWLLEALSRLPVDGEQSDNCLIWNNEPAESFLLSTENSLKEKSCTTDFRSDHNNNNNQQSEFSKLLEKIGLPCQDIGYEGDISHKLSDYCLKSQPTKYSKEDVLELAFCALGKSTASAEELQKVCKVWTENVSNHCLGTESSLESLQFQTSLVSWLGIKHAEVFSRGNRGLRSIEICLQKDSRFIKQDDALWTCTSNHNTRFQELRRAGICAVKRKCNDNKGGKEYSKRKKE